MGHRRLLPLILVATCFGAADTVDQAAARVEQLVSKARPALRAEFRVLAAQTLKERHPDVANKFVKAAFEELRSQDTIDPQLLSELTAAAPEETIALLPHLKPGSEIFVINALIRMNQIQRAAVVYRTSLERDKPGKGQPRVDVAQLLRPLATTNPEDAKKLFQEMLAAFSFDTASPYQLFLLMNCAASVATISPQQAAHVYERIIAIAADPDYKKNAKSEITATFQVGSSTIATSNSRDTLLVAAGARLRALDEDRFQNHKDVLAQWQLSGALQVKRLGAGASNRAERSPAETSISERLGKLRSLPDPERIKSVLEIAHDIHALPKGSKSGWASSLASLATEGDLGKEAIDAVAAALGEGIQEDSPSVRVCLELASLIRYEHARAPFSDPTLEASDAVLALRERVHQDATFALTSMEGKTYSLPALRGKVVLLNFWATWCAPCRKEMPDMEALYRRFEKKGLVVLAVSDEDRETVSRFLEKERYTFPVLLDPGREANKAFDVEGIPKSFIFNAEGKLVAQAIDMRSERQFLELLKVAGIE
jgi:peroxiredoxin